MVEDDRRTPEEQPGEVDVEVAQIADDDDGGVEPSPTRVQRQSGPTPEHCGEESDESERPSEHLDALCGTDIQWVVQNADVCAVRRQTFSQHPDARMQLLVERAEEQDFGAVDGGPRTPSGNRGLSIVGRWIHGFAARTVRTDQFARQCSGRRGRIRGARLEAVWRRPQWLNVRIALVTDALTGHAPTPVPRPVWAAVVTLLAAAVCYSILVPAWRAPDEPAHIDLVYQLSETWTWPHWSDAQFTEGVANRARPTLPQAAEQVPDHRPSLSQLGGAAPSRSSNHVAQHPPTYYAVAAAPLAMIDPLIPEDPAGSAELTVALLRLENALLVAATPLLAWALARRCGAGRLVALTASLVPLLLPGFAQMGGVVNNDNLLVVPLGLAMLGLVAIADGDDRRRVAIACGGAMGFALMTKATAVFVCVPATIVVIGLVRSRGWAHATRTALRLGVPMVALSGWWYGPKLLREHRLVPSRLAEIRRDLPGDSAEFGADFGHWLGTFLEWTSDTFVSRAGIVEVELPDWITIATASIFVLFLAVAALWPSRPAWPRPDRPTALMLVSAPVAMYAVQAYKSWDSFSPDAGLGPLLNARYLYAFMVPLAVLVARGIHVLSRGAERFVPLTLLVAAGALHATAAVEALDRFWGVAPGVEWVDLEAFVAWSPFPPAGTVAILVMTSLAVCWLALTTVQSTVRLTVSAS